MTVILVPLGRAVGAGTREIGSREQNPPPTLRVAVGGRSVWLDAPQTELWRQLHATAPLSLAPLDRSWVDALVAADEVPHHRDVLEQLLDLRVVAEVDLDHPDALVAFSEHVRWLPLAPVPASADGESPTLEQTEVLTDSRTSASLKSAVFAASARFRVEPERTRPILLLRAVMLGAGPLLQDGLTWFDSALSAPRAGAPERELPGDDDPDHRAAIAPIEVPVGLTLGGEHRYGREERPVAESEAAPRSGEPGAAAAGGGAEPETPRGSEGAAPAHPISTPARNVPDVIEVIGDTLVDFLVGHRFEPLRSYVGPWPDDAGPIQLGGTNDPYVTLDSTQTDLWRSAPRRDTLLDGAASLGLSGRIDDLAWYVRRIAELARLGAGYVERARPAAAPAPGAGTAPPAAPRQ